MTVFVSIGVIEFCHIHPFHVNSVYHLGLVLLISTIRIEIITPLIHIMGESLNAGAAHLGLELRGNYIFNIYVW